MPRISTDNYDTVASWNGSEDLFVVEQPDGTKVATPAMVKQFIEAGDFEATGEVKDGHGNVLSGVVDEIGDLTQTGVTGADVATQIGTINNAIGGHNYAVFSKPLTSVSVNTAWGNMYESSLIYIDIKSLGLTSAPLAVFLGVVDAGSSVLFELSSTTSSP